MKIEVLMREARSCRICEPALPHGCRPLIQGSAESRIVVIGQAPGAAAHQSGVPWNDQSGRRLRSWLGVSDEAFYDPRFIAIMPMGFCFPGTCASGDLRPRSECAPAWHGAMLAAFRSVELKVIAGQYAFARYLAHQFPNLTEAVRGYEQLLPGTVALPHPSPRNNRWLARHPWFEESALPRIRGRVRELIDKHTRDVG